MMTTALGGRGRYERRGHARGYRNGHRARQLIGTFGAVTVSLPRAWLIDDDGQAREWKSRHVPAYKRPTRRTRPAAPREWEEN